MTGWLVPAGFSLAAYLEGLAAAAALMTAAWTVSLWRTDASVADGFWGLAIAGLGWWYAARVGTGGATGAVSLVLVTAWGLRLSGYITVRNWGEPEDYRYRQMRERHGSRFPVVSLAAVFLLQAFLAWVVSAPLFQATAAGGEVPLLGWIGAAVAAAGLLWETVADRQLQRFLARREDEDAVLRDGLWRYSRHPNYFGEFVFWWGMFVLVLPTDGPLWSAASPVLMSVLLLRVSGVPMLEEKLAERPAYRRYVERTNAFFPAAAREPDEG